MSLLRAKDASKMSLEERNKKLSELSLELVKANVTAHKSKAKTKEIKRAIARLHTFIRTAKEVHKAK